MQDHDLERGQDNPENPGVDIPDDHDRAPDPDTDPSLDDEDQEPRGVPASDPESGA